jgi:hypothetical protein
MGQGGDMKTRMVEVREGELLGPIDWLFDFDSVKWADGRGGTNPVVVDHAVNLLREVRVGDTIQGSYGDEPRKVLAVGMYDGWPHWKPFPSILVQTWNGFEWQGFTYLQAIVEKAGSR